MSGDWFTLRWSEHGVLMLDQRLLPEREDYLLCTSVEDVAQAIETLAVRKMTKRACSLRVTWRRREPIHRLVRRGGAKARNAASTI